MAIEICNEDTDELLALSEYIKHFNIHYTLLLRRYKRFCEFNAPMIADIDLLTYLDMIVVQLRALCIETAYLKKNYTAQILLRKLGEDALAEKLDVMLETEFLSGVEGYSIKKAIKTLADGFICHYDNYDGTQKDGWAMAAIIEKQLRSPYDKCNLDFIMKTLIDCIGQGLTIKM